MMSAESQPFFIPRRLPASRRTPYHRPRSDPRNHYDRSLMAATAPQSSLQPAWKFGFTVRWMSEMADGTEILCRIGFDDEDAARKFYERCSQPKKQLLTGDWTDVKKTPGEGDRIA